MIVGQPMGIVDAEALAASHFPESRKRGSSGKFRHREGKLVGRKDEEPSLSWIWNQGLPVLSDAVWTFFFHGLMKLMNERL